MEPTLLNSPAHHQIPQNKNKTLPLFFATINAIYGSFPPHFNPNFSELIFLSILFSKNVGLKQTCATSGNHHYYEEAFPDIKKSHSHSRHISEKIPVPEQFIFFRNPFFFNIFSKSSLIYPKIRSYHRE